MSMYSLSKDHTLKTYSLIWLDATDNSEDNITTQEKLRSLMNRLQTFESLDHCEKHFQSVSSNDRIIFVVSGHFSEQLIPKIHSLEQIFSIYIYCTNQQWSDQYNKVNGVYNQINELINQIEYDHCERRQNKPDESLLMSIFDENNQLEQSTTGLDGRFLQSRLLIASLLRMKTNETDQCEFIAHCRELYKGNNKQLQYVNEFERDYQFEHSLWWYTRETFLYRLLNKSLRIQNIDSLFLFRFFINDIAQELHHLRHVALWCLGSLSTYDHSVQRVLFEIDADPSNDGIKPFADLSKISCFNEEEEEEFLMMLGSVFSLKNIYLGEDQIWHIEMNLCENHNGDLQNTYNHLRHQYSLNNQKLLLFANLLIDMAYFNDDAEKYLSRVLKQLSIDDTDIYKCYHALGKISCEKGNYDLSLNYLYESLEILPKSDSRIAYIHNSIGEVYQKQGNIKQALISFKSALKIFLQAFGDHQENVAWCFNNIGIVYDDQKKYHKARRYLFKALNIKTQLLPDKHPCLANTYNNLGNIHYYLQEYDQALEKYQLTYEIFTKSLTPQHPSIARTLKNIGVIYEVQKDFLQARNKYKKAASIRGKILSVTHPDMIEILNDITRVSSMIK